MRLLADGTPRSSLDMSRRLRMPLRSTRAAVACLHERAWLRALDKTGPKKARMWTLTSSGRNMVGD